MAAMPNETRRGHGGPGSSETINGVSLFAGAMAAGWFLAALFMLGGSVAWGALDWAAALGTGAATGTLQIDRCETRSGSRGVPTPVCLGVFRSDAGERDEHADVQSKSKVGKSIPVTRTLLGKYVQQGGQSTAGAVVRTLIFAAVGASCGVAGGRYVHRCLK